MKLTDQRISKRRLNELIEWYSLFPGSEEHEMGLIDALMELKQLRSEKEQREKLNKAINGDEEIDMNEFRNAIRELK